MFSKFIDILFNNKIVTFLSKKKWLLILLWTAIGTTIYISLLYSEEHSIIGSLLLIGIIPVFVGWFIYLLYIPYSIIKHLSTIKLKDIKEDFIDFSKGITKFIIGSIIAIICIYISTEIIRAVLYLSGAE